MNISEKIDHLEHALEYNQCEIERLNESIGRYRRAIQRALDDEESGTGWGPDVTVCGYLQEALMPPKPQKMPTLDDEEKIGSEKC